MSQWTLFSNHGHVLLFLARNPESRLRDVAAEVGITERAVQKIVRDLQDGGFLGVSKQGRRNRYRINTRKPLRHKLEAHRTVGNLVRLISDEEAPPARQRSSKPKPADPARPPWDDETADQPAVPARASEPAPDQERKPPEPPPADPEPAKPPPASEPAPAPARKARKRAAKKRPADDQQGSLF